MFEDGARIVLWSESSDILMSLRSPKSSAQQLVLVIRSYSMTVQTCSPPAGRSGAISNYSMIHCQLDLFEVLKLILGLCNVVTDETCSQTSRTLWKILHPSWRSATHLQTKWQNGQVAITNLPAPSTIVASSSSLSKATPPPSRACDGN